MADVMRELVALLPVDATHVNLSEDLTAKDRALRWLFSMQAAPTAGPLGNLDLRRWRQEMNVGWMTKRRLADAERSGRFDLLHLHTQSCGYGNVGRMQRTPTIVSIDATSRLASREAESTLGRRTYAPNIAADAAVFRAARAIIATSTWAARDVVDIDPSSADKVHVLPFPIRDVFDPDLAAQRYVRSAQSSARPVRALFVGGDFRRKGGDQLLDAFAAAGSLADRAELHLVTKQPVAPRPHVHVYPNLGPNSPELLRLFAEADVFVLPSRGECLAVALMEATAAGLPVVTTTVGALGEAVRPEVSGLLVPPDDTAALRAALDRFVVDAGLRARMGRAGLDLAHRAFDAHRNNSRLLDILADLAEARRLERTAA
jgi:glycosyltransferase involved in cell wall biosynthesis